MSDAGAASRERSVVIDALRGIALLLMVYTHMVFWYAGALLPDAAYRLHADPASRAAVALNGWLVLGKALLLFSFLFGVGFQLQLGRAAPGTRIGARWVWRLVLLGAIGLAHHALWRGDVLTVYAALGLLLLPLRRLGDRALLALALVLAMNVPHRLAEAIDLAGAGQPATLQLAAVAEADRYWAVLARGSFVDLVRDNWSALYSKLQFQLASGRATATLGFLLLGMLAVRQRWFDAGEDAARRLLRVWRIGGFAIAGALVAVAALDVAFEALGVGPGPWRRWGVELLIGSVFDPALVLWYAASAALLLRRPAWHAVAAPLAAVGRLALTAYLGQTACALLLFAPFALGWFGRTSPAANVALALLVFALEAAFAQWWFGHFRFGPVEWLWRSLTLWKRQPLRVAAARGEATALASPDLAG
jgi:uncharacterized protein